MRITNDYRNRGSAARERPVKIELPQLISPTTLMRAAIRLLSRQPLPANGPLPKEAHNSCSIFEQRSSADGRVSPTRNMRGVAVQLFSICVNDDVLG